MNTRSISAIAAWLTTSATLLAADPATPPAVSAAANSASRAINSVQAQEQMAKGGAAETQVAAAAKEAKQKAKAERLAREQAAKQARIDALNAQTAKLEAPRKQAVAEADKALATAKADLAGKESALKSAKDNLAALRKADKPANEIKDAKAALAKAEDAVDGAEDAVKAAEKQQRAAQKALQSVRDDAEDAIAMEERAVADKAKAEAKAIADKARAEKKAKAAEEARKEEERNARIAAEKKAATEKKLNDRRDAIAKEAAALRKEADKAKADAQAALTKAVEGEKTATEKLAEVKGKLAEAQKAEKPDEAAIANLKKEIATVATALQATEDATSKARKAVRAADKKLAAVDAEAEENVDAAEKQAIAAAKAATRAMNKEARQKVRDEKRGVWERLENASADIKKARKNIRTAEAAKADAEAAIRKAEGGIKEIDAIQDAKKRGEMANRKKELGKVIAAAAEARGIADKDIAHWGKELSKAEDAYKTALEVKEKQFPGSHRYRTDKLTEKEVEAIYANLPGLNFVGDRAWLAGTSVDEKPLLDAFIENSAKVEACRIAKESAINGGFYFVGFADAETGTEVKNSTKTILVDCGRIGPVEVEHYVDYRGEAVPEESPRFTDRQIKRKMQADGETTVFNYADIQRRFVDLNGHPDIRKVDIVFTPGLNYEGTLSDYALEDGTIVPNNAGRLAAMKIKVIEKDGALPVHVVFDVNNYNSLGAMDSMLGDADTMSVGATLQLLNLWQADNSLTLNGSASLGGSLVGGSAAYVIPRQDIGKWYDWSWTLHGGYSSVGQDDVVPQIDVDGTGYFGGIYASHRVLESDDSILDLSVGATYRKVESALIYEGTRLDMGLNGEGYEILPVSVALSYSAAKLDRFGGRNYATLEGIYNAGGSSVEEMQAFRQAIEDNKYMLARLQLARIQLLGNHTLNPANCWFLFLRADGQYTPDPIIGAEQYGVGGHNSVRGYAEREFLGDTGFSGTIELRTPIYVGLFSDYLGWSDGARPVGAYAIDRTQFVTFLDVGQYTLLKGINNTEDDSETLFAWGVGMRLALSDTFQARFDYGIPLVKDDEKFETSAAGRVSFSLSLQF